jgi:hypothetical protein
MSDSEPRQIVVTVAAPVDALWQALRDPAEIRRWFGWEYEDMYGFAGLDEEIEVIFGAATASDDERMLRWPDGDALRLEEQGETTIVRVTRAAPADGAGWDDVYDEITEGWLAFFQQLRFALERHPGEDRQTLHLTGTIAARGAGPAEALGLEALGATAGSRYEAATPFGAALSGEVWYRTEHQLGVTVAGLGDGLLVLTEQPVASEDAPRQATATLTTYGLDDRSFASTRELWASWWNAHYEESRVLQA